MDKKELLEKTTGIEVKTLEYISSGWDSSAYLLNNSQIAKFANREEAKKGILVEAKVLKLLTDNSFKLAPRLLFADAKGQFILMTRIQGRQCQVGDFNSQLLHELTKIVFTLAAYNPSELAELRLEMDAGLGERFAFLGSQQDILKHYLDEQQAEFLQLWLDKAQDLEAFSVNQLCHNDIGIDHVFVDGGKISGIIDWADAKLSDPAYEFGRFLRETCDLKLIEECLSGFPLTDNFIEKMKAYAVLSCAEDITDGHNDGNSDYAKEYAAKIGKLQKLFASN